MLEDTNPATRTIQPPLPGTGDCWQEIIDEARSQGWPPSMVDLFAARRQLGIDRYGQPVQHGDGRGLDDALQEALDLAVYLWREGQQMLAWDALRLAREVRRRGEESLYHVSMDGETAGQVVAVAAMEAERQGFDLQGVAEVVKAVLMGRIIGDAIAEVRAAYASLPGAVDPASPEK